MDNEIKFLSLQKTVQQLSFDGHNMRVEVPVGEIHILYLGSCLCGTDKEKLKRKYDTKQTKITKLRPEGKICVLCERKYKQHSNLAWYRWADSSVPF